MRRTACLSSAALAALLFSLPAAADHTTSAPEAGASDRPERVVYRVDCDSDGYAHTRCEAPDGVYVFRVALTRQDSITECVENENWGVDPRGVWVDDGCAGEFRLFGRDIGDAAPETLACGSGNYGRANCRAASELVFSARLERQRSTAACVENDTWGWDQYGVWVDDGCRADFVLNDPRDGGGFAMLRGHGSGGAHRGWGAHATASEVEPAAAAVEAPLDAREQAVAACSRHMTQAALDGGDYSAQFERPPETAPATYQSASLAPPSDLVSGDAWRVTGPVIVHGRYGYQRVQTACTVERGGVTAFEQHASAD